MMSGGRPILPAFEIEERQYHGPDSSDGSVSIAVLTFNRSARLGELLASLADVVRGGAQLVVVDNNSRDDTQEVVARAGVPLLYLRTSENIGVAARNLGLQRASGDIVVCLDDDVFGIDEQALRAIRAAFTRNPRLGALNFKVLDPWTNGISNWVHHCQAERFANAAFATYEITEGAVAFRRSALEAAGWYADYFFLSHEGPDLAIRMMDRGYAVRYSGQISVVHWHDSQGRTPWRRYYYDTRNQYWLAARSLPAGYAARYLLRGQLSTCLYALRDGFLIHWLRGVRDGIAGLATVWGDRRVVSAATMGGLRAIDADRPSVAYMARKRLFRRAIRL